MNHSLRYAYRHHEKLTCGFLNCVEKTDRFFFVPLADGFWQVATPLCKEHVETASEYIEQFYGVSMWKDARNNLEAIEKANDERRDKHNA